MRTVIVTGANGYLGNVLVPMLHRAGYNVIPVDLNLFCPPIDLAFASAADIRDIDWNHWFNTFWPVEAVIHLAGISNDPASELNPTITDDINTRATARLVLASAQRVPKFVFASSAAVYGAQDDLADEFSYLNPLTEYARSKADSEAIILDMASKTFRPVILRFGTLFGPSRRMRFDLAINLMVKDAITTGEIKVFGGKQWRPFLHVVDASRAIIHALNYTGGDKLFNIIFENLDIITLANRVRRVLSPLEIAITQAELSDARNYALDNTLMLDKFMFCPSCTIERGVFQVAGWVLDAIDKNVDLNADQFYTLRMWKKFIAGG